MEMAQQFVIVDLQHLTVGSSCWRNVMVAPFESREAAHKANHQNHTCPPRSYRGKPVKPKIKNEMHRSEMGMAWVLK